MWRGKVIVNVRFTRRGEEKHPILFDGRASRRWIASEFSKGGVGFERTKRGSGGGGGQERCERRVQSAEVDEPETEAGVPGSINILVTCSKIIRDNGFKYCVLTIIRGSPLPLQKIRGS